MFHDDDPSTMGIGDAIRQSLEVCKSAVAFSLIPSSSISSITIVFKPILVKCKLYFTAVLLSVLPPIPSPFYVSLAEDAQVAHRLVLLGNSSSTEQNDRPFIRWSLDGTLESFSD